MSYSRSRAIRRKKRRRTALRAAIFLLLAGMIAGYFTLVRPVSGTCVIHDGNQTVVLQASTENVEQLLSEAGISLSPEDNVSVSRSGKSLEITVLRGDSGEKEFTSGETLLSQPHTEEAAYLTHPRTVTETDAPASVPLVEADSPAEDCAPSGINEEEYAVEVYTEPEPESEPEPEPEPEPEDSGSYDDSDDYDDSNDYDDYDDSDDYSDSDDYDDYDDYDDSGDYDDYDSYDDSDDSDSSYDSDYGFSYSSVIYVEATAYTGGGTTATGTPARYGAIAVDPSVIPYGTRMYIVSDDGRWVYGYATAEDCGGAIKGHIIDLYFDDYDTCIQFGRRNCTVYILD